MKKSSVIIFAGIFLAIVTLAAANMKLKKEYDKKNIREYLIYNSLPSFHYVKDDFNSNQAEEWYTCNIRSGPKYGVGSGFATEKILSFVVKNDTLFISKPNNLSMINMVWGIPVTIFCGSLKGVTANSCVMTLDGAMADSITITANRRAQVKVQHLQTGYLEVNADNSATVWVGATDSIKSVHIRLKDKSSFAADNVLIGEKTLRLSDSASLKLTGRSLANFGIHPN